MKSKIIFLLKRIKETPKEVLDQIDSHIFSLSRKGEMSKEALYLEYLKNRIDLAYYSLDYLDPKSFEDQMKNLIKESFSYNDSRYKFDIIRNDDEIKLYIKDHNTGEYLATNAFIFNKDKEYFFNTRYLDYVEKKVKTIRLNTRDIVDSVLFLNKQDETLFDFVNRFDDEKTTTRELTKLIEFKDYYNSSKSVKRDYIRPDEFERSFLFNKDKETLIKLKDKYLNQLLGFTKKIKLDTIEEDKPFYVVSDDNILGNISLLGSYIDVINQELECYQKGE